MPETGSEDKWANVEGRPTPSSREDKDGDELCRCRGSGGPSAVGKGSVTLTRLSPPPLILSMLSCDVATASVGSNRSDGGVGGGGGGDADKLSSSAAALAAPDGVGTMYARRVSSNPALSRRGAMGVGRMALSCLPVRGVSFSLRLRGVGDTLSGDLYGDWNRTRMEADAERLLRRMEEGRAAAPAEAPGRERAGRTPDSAGFAAPRRARFRRSFLATFFADSASRR